MNKFPFFIILYITLIGCVPSTLSSTQQSQLERPFTGTATLEPQTTEVTNNPLPREMITPNPARQILDNTSWALKYAIINDEREELKANETLHIFFRPDSVGLYDGCNQMSYGYVDGRPGYVANDNGEFIYPLPGSGEDDDYSIMRGSTELYCFHVDEESGEQIKVGVPDFLPPFEEIVAYELSPRQLRLYYPEDRRNVLVFERLSIPPQPTETATQIPQPTMTAYPGPTTTVEVTIPVPYPGPPTATSTPLPPYP